MHKDATLFPVKSLFFFVAVSGLKVANPFFFFFWFETMERFSPNPRLGVKEAVLSSSVPRYPEMKSTGEVLFPFFP